MPAAATSRSDSVPRPRLCFVFGKSFSEARRRGSLRQKAYKDFSEVVPETSPPLSLITPQSGPSPLSFLLQSSHFCAGSSTNVWMHKQWDRPETVLPSGLSSHVPRLVVCHLVVHQAQKRMCSFPIFPRSNGLLIVVERDSLDKKIATSILLPYR